MSQGRAAAAGYCYRWKVRALTVLLALRGAGESVTRNGLILARRPSHAFLEFSHVKGSNFTWACQCVCTFPFLCLNQITVPREGTFKCNFLLFNSLEHTVWRPTQRRNLRVGTPLWEANRCEPSAIQTLISRNYIFMSLKISDLLSKVFDVWLSQQELGSDGIPHLVAKCLQFVETYGMSVLAVC